MIDIIRREIDRALRGLRAPIRASLRGLDLAAPVQTANMEGLAGEELQEVEVFQQFGFTSAPPVGAEQIVLPLGGRTSAAVVIASEHGEYRLVLGAAGEVALYNAWGDSVHMRQDRTIVMTAAVEVTVNAPRLQVNGDIACSGDITADGHVADAGGAKTMAGMRGVFNAHTHAENDAGGPTEAPAGGM